MSAPTVAAVFPPPNSTDAVLRTRIWVEFDQPVDPASVTPATFAVLSPDDTVLLNPSQALDPRRRPAGSRPVAGRIVQESPSRFAFVPAEPLRPQVRYQAIVIGGSGAPGGPAVRNPAGEVLARSYQWFFTTGTLDLEQPPVASPVNLLAGQPGPVLAEWMLPQLDPARIQVVPVMHPDGMEIGGLPFSFEIVFPGPIDPGWLQPGRIQVWLEPPGGYPQAAVPEDLEAVLNPSGDRLIVTLRRR